MIRWTWMVGLLAIAGCNEKRDQPTTTTTTNVAPTPMPTTTAAPSGAAVAPPDMQVMATHPVKPPSAPPPIGVLPHK